MCCCHAVLFLTIAHTLITIMAKGKKAPARKTPKATDAAPKPTAKTKPAQPQLTRHQKTLVNQLSKIGGEDLKAILAAIEHNKAAEADGVVICPILLCLASCSCSLASCALPRVCQCAAGRTRSAPALPAGRLCLRLFRPWVRRPV
jgi:hypothetical protein